MFHKEITLVNPLDAKSDSLTVQASKDDSLFGIQFLPESGRYVPGDLAVFAFKAVTTDGRGIGVTGAVLNSRDSIITSFSDTYKGMGKLLFHPAPNERYYAVIRSEQGTELKQSLPALSETGAVIHVTKRGDKRFIRTVVTGSLLEKPLFIVLSNGSEVFLCNRITQQEYEIAMKEAWLLNGINHATIVDEEGRVFAQRIFFVYPPDLIRADIFADKPEPDKREKITYTIWLLDTLETGVEGTFSLSVTDRYLTPHTASDHLLSYMLLSSELSGAVEDPAALFDFSREGRSEAMDLVMMIHGWRYYDIPAIIKNTIPNSLPEKEYSQTISGKVSSFYNRVSNSDIIIYSPAINLSYFEPMDHSGLFRIRNLDFPDSTQFVLSCTGKRGSTEYYLEIDLPSFPSVDTTQFLSNTTALTGQHFKDILEETSTLLEEVVVTASQHLVKPAVNPSPFNQSFETRQIRERKQLEKFDGMLLMDYLISSFGSISNGGADENGVAEISFYTSDRKTAYRFSIEGITSDGDCIAILKNL